MDPAPKKKSRILSKLFCFVLCHGLQLSCGGRRLAKEGKLAANEIGVAVITTSIHADVAGRSEPHSWGKNETTSSVFFARMFAKNSEPPNSDVGGSDSRNAEAKKTA